MTPPALYRHRPTIIHALQLTPDTVDDIRDWLDQAHQGGYHISDDNGHLLLDTLEGDRDVLTEDGYWVAEGVAGEFYPVRADIFARTYEPAVGAAMSTRLHQTWDLGDGTLTLDLSHVQPLPSSAYAALAELQRAMADAADRLNRILGGAA